MTFLCSRDNKEHPHIYLKLPVKFIPARSGDFITTSPNSELSDGTKLITPGGNPAS